MHTKKCLAVLCFFLFSNHIHSDSFTNNSFNNHGVIGLVNIPTARFFDESSYGFSIYDGDPDTKITMTSFPYDWLEASFFYNNIDGLDYCSNLDDPVCKQDYKDKGFNFKVRVKKEGVLPAIAIGINDIAGTGFYSSEYIVASYGLKNLDFHFGLGWGSLNGSKYNFKNPLGLINESFYDRPKEFEDLGGQFQPSRYFSDKKVSPFFGISFVPREGVILKIEHDSTVTPGMVGYQNKKSEYSYGLDFEIFDNFVIGISNERNTHTSLKFIYKNHPKTSKKEYSYVQDENIQEKDRYKKLRKNLSKNGIGVNKIYKASDSIGLEITQFSHPNLDTIEKIIYAASSDAGINEEIKKDYRIADLQAYSDIDDEYIKNSEIIYNREFKQRWNSDTRFVLRPFLAAREGFFKASLLLENNNEFIIKENFFFSSNLKYSIWDNFDDLVIPPKDTFPAQVRSDIKEYLREIDQGIVIGRAQIDYHITPKEYNHLMFTAGILEEMFQGYGFEYLYFKNKSNHAFGFELFDVKKRDYGMRFGTLNYSNITGSINYYYRNYKYIPFDAKISYGEYLAGDKGFTIDLSRTFLNGTKFGFFATFTDVSANDFGEGSFDKGIYFNIPVYKNMFNYSWRPLTKDPGARLNRKHSLYDLLVKFKPYNY